MVPFRVRTGRGCWGLLGSWLLTTACGSSASPSEPGAEGAGGAGGGTGIAASDAGGGGTPEGRPTLFYLDILAGAVLRQAPGDPDPTVLVDSGSNAPDGIAVDVSGGHLFWTNMGDAALDDGFILRADLDGARVTTIIPPGGTHTPKQLKIDSVHGKLYWSDREGMRVQRANLDGTASETLVTVATGDVARADLSHHCVGMAVDPSGGFFYWSQKGPDNGHQGSIRRAHMDFPPGEDSVTRTDVEILFEALPEPIDLELDLAGGHVYWTDRGDDTVNRAPIGMPPGATAATRTDREILVPGVGEAIGITLDPRRHELYYTGLSGQLGRAGYDGAGAVDLRTGAGLLTGIAFVELP